MSKRMLIDSSHPEETRVVVLDGQKVEEFEFEAASKRPLKGNIYLAKVTRVEPSLQAAFVEYGGNRQGFLAFSEIHPDYYQIPVADRMALIAEAEAEARRRQDDEVESFEITSGPKPQSDDAEEESEAGATDHDSGAAAANDSTLDNSPTPEAHVESGSDEIFTNHPEQLSDAILGQVAASEPAAQETQEAAVADFDEIPPPADRTAEGQIEGEQHRDGATSAADEPAPVANQSEAPDRTAVEPAGSPQGEDPGSGEPAPESNRAQALAGPKPTQRWGRRKHYRIQEVVKRRQIILVQVVKEERGTKGAALTTYLSLAGRYCVLMPNTPRGGGISRKITNAADRKRLKAAAQALELPEGMGLIIRTAGENRTKIEIRRDYEYLVRLWDTIRELTLKSNAPSCVHEEGDLIKRAIRDLYNKDVTEVVVEGEAGYRNAKDFMRMLMPSHAKNVKFYKEPVPLFQSHHIEAQLDQMFSPAVTLRSGGYIVINQTEALVSIDVNSGRATREHSIEETAHKTNLEAADEIARQLRLRDLAGLIVIDFIDMEDARNDRDVEKRLRDAVRNDRARVQIGRISQFGLLEMSRQRLRAGVIAGSTVPCPYCAGQGIVRSVESTALRVLRALEEEGQAMRASAVSVRVRADVAIYALNQKRKELARIETDYGMSVAFEPKDGLAAGNFEIERTTQKTPEERAKLISSKEFAEPPPALSEVENTVEVEAEVEADVASEAVVVEGEEVTAEPAADARQFPQGDEGGGRRRRRRRRGGRDRDRPFRERREPARDQGALPSPQIAGPSDEGSIDKEGIPAPSLAVQSQVNQPGEGGRRRRRRRRRGRRGQGNAVAQGEVGANPQGNQGWNGRYGNADDIDTTPLESQSDASPASAKRLEWQQDNTSAPIRSESQPDATPANETAPGKPSGNSASDTERSQPTRRGWWQRTFRPEG